MFIEPFPNFFPMRFAHSNGRLQLAVGFAFSFGQHKSVGRSLTFRVLASSRGRLISEEIW